MQTGSGTTFNDVRDEMYHVVQLRKNTGGIINELYSAINTERVQSLSKVKIELANTDIPNVPNLGQTDQTDQAFKDILRQHDDTMKKLRNHIKLLDMLEQKQNCPIAKVVDEI